MTSTEPLHERFPKQRRKEMGNLGEVYEGFWFFKLEEMTACFYDDENDPGESGNSWRRREKAAREQTSWIGSWGVDFDRSVGFHSSLTDEEVECMDVDLG